MSAMARLATQYAALKTASVAQDLAHLEFVHVTVTSARHAELAAIEGEIAALEATCNGWARRQSKGALCPLGDLAGDFRRHGVPLAGEWALDGGAGVALRWDGAGWRLTTITETEANAPPAIPCLRQELDYLHSRTDQQGEHDIRRLRYAVYWGASPSGGDNVSGFDDTEVRRLFARFIGFAREHAR